MKASISTIIVCLGLLANSGCATKSISAQLQRYGFAELRPPSKFAQPGTIIRIVNRNPFDGRTVCPAPQALGPRVSDPALVGSSPSASAEMQQAFSGTFKLDAAYLDKLKLNASFESVKNLKLQLSNVKIFDLPDSSVFKLVKDRDPDCARAIKFRQDNKEDVTMINRALVADAQYSITWSRKVESNVKAEVTKQLAGNLGVEVSWSGEDSFKGENLIWGVTDDSTLLKISPELLATGAGPAPRLVVGQPLKLTAE